MFSDNEVEIVLVLHYTRRFSQDFDQDRPLLKVETRVHLDDFASPLDVGGSFRNGRFLR